MPTVVQLTNNSKGPASCFPVSWSTAARLAPNSSARSRALLSVRFQISTSAPARTRAQTAARAEPPAPMTSARLPAGEPGSASSSRRVGVLGHDPSLAEAQCVGGADLARGIGGLVGDLQRRDLVRDGDVDPGEALRRAPPTRSANRPRRRRSPRIPSRRRAPARPGQRCASRASASARRGVRGRPVRHPPIVRWPARKTGQTRPRARSSADPKETDAKRRILSATGLASNWSATCRRPHRGRCCTRRSPGRTAPGS